MKNFKLFEKCNRRIARRVTLIAVLLAMCIPQAWAGINVATNSHLDFYVDVSATNKNWKDHVALTFGNGSASIRVPGTHLNHTKLWYCYLNTNWSDLYWMAAYDADWGTGEGKGYSDYSTYIGAGYVSAQYMPASYNLNANALTLVYVGSASTSPTISLSTVNDNRNYDYMNYTIDLESYVKVGAAAYSKANAKGAITAGSYKIYGNNISVSSTSASLSTSQNTTSIRCARTAETSFSVGTPSSGYEFVGWYDGNGDPLSSATEYTDYNPSSNATVRAYFAQTHTVTFGKVGSGTVSPSGNQTVGQKGVTITASSPGRGYYFAGWTCTGGASVTDASATSTTVTATSGGTVTANFKPIWYLKGDFNSWGEDNPISLASTTSGSVDLVTTSANISNSKFKIWNKQTDIYYQIANASVTRANPTPSGSWTTGGTSNDMKFNSDIIDTYRFNLTYSSNIPSALSVTYPTPSYTINYRDKGDNAFTGNHMPGYPATHTYATETTLKKASKQGYTFDGWYTSSDCTTGLVTSIGATAYTAEFKLYAKWTAVSLVDLANNTLYKATDIAPSGLTVTSTAQYYPGVSADSRFNGLGTGNADATSGPVGFKTENNTVDGTAFTSSVYFSKSASPSSNVPSHHAIQFKIPSDGVLEVWVSSTSGIYLSNGTTATQITSSTHRELDVSSGTWYLYSTTTSKKLYGLRFKKKYAVSYAAGTYGTGSLAAGAKVHGTDFTLSSSGSAFSRDGYTYDGWSESTDGSTKDYELGGTYSTDAAITLYPHWVPKRTMTYDANGGSGTTTDASSPYANGTEVTTIANGFSYSGYKFKWWNTKSNGSGEDFYVDEKFNITQDTTLYAQWEEEASGWAYWNGNVAAANNATTNVTGNGVTMVLTRSSTSSGYVDWNTGLTADATVVNKYSSTNKHAKVLAVAKNDAYLQVHFTDGSPINTLELGVTAKDDGDYEMIVIYSTTADFSSGTGEKVVHNTPRHSQTSKSVTDFSPLATNKYPYARIYRYVSSAVYSLTGGSEHTIRIYSIKAEAGSSCSAAPTVSAATTGTTTPTTQVVNCAGISSLGTGTCTITSYGFVYGTSANPTTSDNVEEVGTTYTTTNTAFSKTIESLTPGATYYVRAYATNGYGTAYGDQTSFTMQYAITTGSHTNGSVTIPSSAAPSASVAISATPSTGYSFSSWTIKKTSDGSDVTTSVSLSGTTSATFTMPDYAVTVDATFSCTTPTITGPSNATVCKDDDSPELSVSASANGGSLSYQWYVNTTNAATVDDDHDIDGATNDSYDAPTGTAGTKYYYCVVTNTTGGCSATSDIATVTVKGAATITWGTQPADGTVGDDDFAYAVSCSDGSTVTVTSNNTSYGTIVDGKLHYVAAGTTYLIATATDACGNKIVQNSNNFTVSAALSSKKELLGLKFSNGFDAFIDETYHTVTAYYLYGTSAPTVSSHTESVAATYSKEGNTITITAEDGTTQDYTLTLSTVTPYAGTGSEETFTGSETYIKGGIWEDSEWNIRKNSNDDDRQQKGLNRLYFFIDECSTITLTSSCGNSRNIYVYRNGTKLDSPTSIGTSGATIEIAGSASPALYAILPNGTNGDIEMNKIMITPNCTSPGVLSVVPNTGYIGAGSYQYGDELTLTASCADGTNASTTYAWYKGADWSTAKAAGAIQSAKTAAAGGTTYTKSAELSDAGTYWCEASNGSGCETHNLSGADISVGKAAFTPDLEYESLPIPVGSTRDPVLTGVPDGAGAATYTSSDTDVAEVDSETGVVTAKAAGTATIRVDIAESSNYIARYDTKLISVREAVLYTVTFDPNGGTIDESSDPVVMTQATEGAALTMPTPVHATYTFDGWYIADTEIGDEGAYTPTKNVTAYAKWIEECSGGSGKSVRFLSTNKNDAGDNFADMSTSSNTTQMVGDGTAKLIAIGSAGLNDANNKIGYRDDGRLNVVFKFSEATTLDIYFNANATSKTFKLSSFSSDKALKDIATSDYSSRTVVTSGITVAGAAFASSGKSTTSSAGSASSGVITLTTAGGIKVTYSSLAASCYVFEADGSGNEGYLYGFDINGGSSSGCYRVNYHSNGADGGLTFDPLAYDEGDLATVVANGFTFEHETEFIGWNTAVDGSGTMYRAGDKLSISDDDIELYAQWMPINRFQATEDWFWNNEDNWSHGVLPSASHKVIIEKPCELRSKYGVNPIAKVKTVVIDKYGDNTGRLTIAGPAGLAVEEMIKTKNAEGVLVGTSTTDLNIESSSDHENGALAVKGYTEEGGVDLKATVTPKTKARVYGWSVAGEYIGFYVNQFIGTPMLDAKGSDYYGSWLYRWDATAPEEGPDAGKGDWVYASGALAPFQGYTLLFDNHDETYLWLRGTLVYSDSKVFNLAYDERHENLAGTETMLANSYLAPIDVTTMTTTDFAGGDEDKMEATIYVFNSGTPNNWSDNEKEGKGNIGELPGQFLCMSIHSAEYTGGITEISSMQAFSVYAKSTGATFNLDYERMVYNPLKNRVTGIAPMRAPSNKASANDNAPDVMKIMVECEHGADKLFMLTREDFNAGFDNGWDARKMFGESFAPQLYAFTPDGNMSVNCVPDEEGAVLGFRKGSADDVYTFSFTYNGEKMLYLNDTKEQLSTLINDDAEYTFVSETGDTEARFIISETPYNAPAVTTGFDGINAEQKAKVHKVLINDHIYIIRGGRMYDATGKMLK